MTDLKFAVDLITFFHPDFWDVASAGDISALAQDDPRMFWDKMLETIAQSGVRGVETSISPLDHHSALAAYGSVEQVKAVFEAHGLQLVSGFYHDFERFGDLADPAVRSEICKDACQLGAFLAAMGGETLVLGLPMRKTKGEDPIEFVDFNRVLPLATLCNELGAALAKLGLGLALHTEGHSVMCTARDVDLFMLLTDPLYVDLCPDSAHLLLCGGDPVEIFERHRQRVSITHWKDATGAMPLDVNIDPEVHTLHRNYFCTLGAGRVDWHAWAKAHSGAGFSGWMVLEVDASPDPLSTIRDSRAYVETAVAHLLG